MTKRLRDTAIGCRGKHSYPTLPAAQRAADELGRRRGNVGGRAHAYACHECQGFHIGRRIEGRKSAPSGRIENS